MWKISFECLTEGFFFIYFFQPVRFFHSDDVAGDGASQSSDHPVARWPAGKTEKIKRTTVCLYTSAVGTRKTNENVYNFPPAIEPLRTASHSSALIYCTGKRLESNTPSVSPWTHRTWKLTPIIIPPLDVIIIIIM